MSAPTIPVLGASTVNRRYITEINLTPDASPTWTVVGGLMNSQFQPSTGNWVDNTDQAGEGAQSSNKSGYTWSVDLSVDRKVGKIDPTTYDPAQEFLRLAALEIGTDNTVEVRVFEFDPNDPDGTKSPRTEAYHGFAGVDWVPDGGDMMANSTVKVSLKGQGKLDTISHPYPAAASVPVVVSISPNAALPAAGGTAVLIKGHAFTGVAGASHVTFGGTNATSYTVINDQEIVAVAPAHAAGTVAVVVTNATGASSGAATATYV